MSKWIKVTEKLPDKDGRYLVVFDKMEREYCIAFSSFSVERNEFNHIDITHWQPSPLPPEECE